MISAEELKSFFDRIKSHRQSGHDEDWRLISRYFDPQSHGFYDNNNTDGNVDRSAIWDSAPERAKEDLASSMVAMTVDPRRKYLNFEVVGLKEKDKTHEIKLFLQEAENYVLDVFSTSESNFFGTAVNVLDECPLYGQAYATMMKSPEEKITKFAAVHCKEGYVLRDTFKKPVMFFRLMRMTARQILREYGNAEGSELTSNDIDDYKTQAVVSPGKEYDIVHAIIPSDDALISEGYKFKYASIYLDYSKTKIVKKSGFDDFPILAPPWKLKADEDYGRGVGHRALADTAVLNLMVKDNLAAAQVILMPPIALPFGLTIDGTVNLSPMAINYLDFNSGVLATGEASQIKPINVVRELPISLEMEDRRRQGIREAFYADLLQELKTDRMTATESGDRSQSRSQKMTGPFFNIEQHFLSPAATYTLNAGIEFGVLKVPDVLKGKKLKPVFTTALVDALKFSKLASLERAMSSFANTAGLPEPAQDALNMADLAGEIFDLAGASLKFVKSQEEADKTTKQKQEAQMNLQNAQAIAQTAQGLRSLGQAAESTRGL